MIVNNYEIKSMADLRGADLSEADLSEANLYKADLSGADLSRADLYKANLRRADLRRADLYGANLYGADLSGANLYKADLRGTKGIMSFNGEKDLLVYFYYDNEHYFKIGCKILPYKDWLKDYKKIGKENDYTNDQIELYGTIIKTFSKYDLSGA